MKKFKKQIILLAIAWLLPVFSSAQGLCEPIYSVDRVITSVGSYMENMQGNNGYQMQMVIGAQRLSASNFVDNVYTHQVASGLFGDYLTEPKPPLVRASDGDFQDMVLVEWDIEGDDAGPPVTSSEVTLYRNGYVLTTLPIQQTEYQDFNVFPGEYYNYGVGVSNEMGESKQAQEVGFLNPNGMITGHIETPSGSPVFENKVILTPNLGRSAKFDGDGYVYWFDGEINTNRQFDGLSGDYSVEMWFRTLFTEQQTLFAAVDSN